ncbi:unnamed protein product [Effrenium voratum]|nr:unnamed protein product [Effrenium voratum]
MAPSGASCCRDLSTARSRDTPPAWLSAKLGKLLQAAVVGSRNAAGLRMCLHRLSCTPFLQQRQYYNFPATMFLRLALLDLFSSGNLATSQPLRFQGWRALKCNSKRQSWSGVASAASLTPR